MACLNLDLICRQGRAGLNRGVLVRNAFPRRACSMRVYLRRGVH